MEAESIAQIATLAVEIIAVLGIGTLERDDGVRAERRLDEHGQIDERLRWQLVLADLRVGLATIGIVVVVLALIVGTGWGVIVVVAR